MNLAEQRDQPRRTCRFHSTFEARPAQDSSLATYNSGVTVLCLDHLGDFEESSLAQLLRISLREREANSARSLPTDDVLLRVREISVQKDLLYIARRRCNIPLALMRRKACNLRAFSSLCRLDALLLPPRR
jgi:hypothetical protein